MSETDYFICKTEKGDIIACWDEYLRIRVISLNDQTFVPDHHEIRYYGDDHGKPLIFETIDYNHEDKKMIVDAIKWYASCINYPEMAILSDQKLQ